MVDAASDLNLRIADRLRELRSARGLSLDALASRSGVSRSMISLIERGESSPTAVVLDRLANGLGVMLATFFDTPPAAAVPPSPLIRRDEQPSWRDPGSGYVRRNVSPSGVSQPMQIVEVHFPAGARVAFETGMREAPVHQQIWILDGTIEITYGDERYRLHDGDCLAIHLDRPMMFHNPTRKPARYAVVVGAEPQVRR